MSFLSRMFSSAPKGVATSVFMPPANLAPQLPFARESLFLPADCEMHPIHLYFIRGYDTSAYCVPVTQALDLLTVSTTVQELERQISIGLPVFRAPLAGCEDDGLMHMIRISDLPELGAAYKRASMGIEIF